MIKYLYDFQIAKSTYELRRGNKLVYDAPLETILRLQNIPIINQTSYLVRLIKPISLRIYQHSCKSIAFKEGDFLKE